MVGDQKVEKLIELAPNIWTAGAGTAADCNHVSRKSLIPPNSPFRNDKAGT